MLLVFNRGLSHRLSYECAHFCNVALRRTFSQRVYRILGIETRSSCDDTAVALVTSNREVLYSKKVNDKSSIALLGGIAPGLFALKHRTAIKILIDECASLCGVRFSDLDAISVSTRPGLIVSLKVGVDKALALAREYHLPLIPVHHMRAHAIVARLVHANLPYPFLALLVSGGHAQIVVVRDAQRFLLLGESLSGSPGECLDKLARVAGLTPDGPHFAAALERVAKRADSNGHLRFLGVLPDTPGAQFNFSSIKSHYLNIWTRLRPTDEEIPNFCASAQFTVMSHLCKKLDVAFQFIERSNQLNAEFDGIKRNLVVSGGVASNTYLVGCIRRLAEIYNFATRSLPSRLCTDNGEMVAWLGAELLSSGSNEIYQPDKLPTCIELECKAPIGESIVMDVSTKRPPRRLKVNDLHNAAI